MRDLPSCRILCVQSQAASGEDLIERVRSFPSRPPPRVEVVSDTVEAFAQVKTALEAQMPFPIVVVHPSSRAHWVAEAGSSAIWGLDPHVYVVLCDHGDLVGESIDERMPPAESKGRLIHLSLPRDEENERDDQLLHLIVTNAVLSRQHADERLETLARETRLDDLQHQLFQAQDTILSIRQKLEASSASRLFLASHDPLTHLPNRARFEERLAEEVARTQQDPLYQFMVLLLNLNRFKAINDSFGHQHGDQLLIEISNRLKALVRSHDMVCRLGADEFAIVLSETDKREDGPKVAQRILHSSTTQMRIDGRGLPVSAAIGGVVGYADQYHSAEELMRDANVALARAKSRGGSRIEFFLPSEHSDDRKQLELESYILHALEHEEFSLHYQPIISLKDRSIAGFEELLRWHHPVMGSIPPNQFITIAEKNGLIDPLGEWILQRGCTDLRAMQEVSSNPHLFMTLNISHRQLFRTSFAERALEIIGRCGVDPKVLCFELTETTMIDDFEVVLTNIQVLKAAGIRIFIDDFGVGYSSLNSLQRLPADCLKIDRGFISAMAQSSKGEAIVRSIIEMGHTLDLKLVAEGIEDEEELRRVTSMKCDYGQGFYFARGIAIEEALRVLHEGRTF